MSQEPVVEIHILQCGQGDTILLHLFGEKWVLVDCNLPNRDEQDRFFEFVSSRNIQTLNLLCLTHPHEDHYTGMEAVVEYFTSHGRSIGIFCDSGLDPKQIGTLLRRRERPDFYVQEFEKLYLRLRPHFLSHQIVYFRADKNTNRIPVGVKSGQVKLLPVGPSPDIIHEFSVRGLSPEGFRGDLNRISVVLALIVRLPKNEFAALLAADTDGNGFNSALEGLMDKTDTQTVPCFDVIKVAHHGSLHSHRNSTACSRHKVEGECIAAVSTGSFEGLPDREVLADYLNHKWKVILTTKRIKARDQSLLYAFGEKSVVRKHDLCITWSEELGLRWTPAEASLDDSELDAYQTASKSKSSAPS